MATYERTGISMEITVTVGHDVAGYVDIRAHMDVSTFALRFDQNEALELAMLLVKHATASGTRKVA